MLLRLSARKNHYPFPFLHRLLLVLPPCPCRHACIMFALEDTFVET